MPSFSSQSVICCIAAPSGFCAIRSGPTGPKVYHARRLIPAPAASLHVRSGSRLCENGKTLNRDRRSCSSETALVPQRRSGLNLEAELKNIILRGVSIFEFLHSQGPSRPGSVSGLRQRRKSLNLPGDNSVYCTVCWMLRWPARKGLSPPKNRSRPRARLGARTAPRVQRGFPSRRQHPIMSAKDKLSLSLLQARD
jgi:hypothetical protein